MIDKPVTGIEAVEPEPDREYSQREVCLVCDLDGERLHEWVAEGVIRPRGGSIGTWRFSARQLHRARIARRLQCDLAIDTTGLPLVLDLVEELRSLRARVRVLERQVEDEESSVSGKC